VGRFPSSAYYLYRWTVGPHPDRRRNDEHLIAYVAPTGADFALMLQCASPPRLDRTGSPGLPPARVQLTTMLLFLTLKLQLSGQQSTLPGATRVRWCSKQVGFSRAPGTWAPSTFLPHLCSVQRNGRGFSRLIVRIVQGKSRKGVFSGTRPTRRSRRGL